MRSTCRGSSKHSRKQRGGYHVNCRKAQQPGPPSARSRAFERSRVLERLLAVAWRDQIVLHRKNVGNLVGAQARDIFISFVVHHALQRDVAILHDDMDGGHGLNGVAREGGVAINGAVQGAAELVIHRGNRKHLDVIHNRGHSLNALYGGLGVGFQRWPSYLSIESYLIALHLVPEIVEHGIPRQHNELVPDFLVKVLSGLWFALFFLIPRPSRRGGLHCHNGRREQHRYKQGPEFLSHDFLPGRLPILFPHLRSKLEALWLPVSVLSGGVSIFLVRTARMELFRGEKLCASSGVRRLWFETRRMI